MSEAPILRKSLDISRDHMFTKNEDGSVSTVIMFSDDDVDYEGDVVEQNWTSREKVALLVHHDRMSDPIGRVDELWTEGNQSFAKITFHAPDKDPRGGKYAYFAEFGSMTGVSAGFIAKRASIAEDRLKSFDYPLNIKDPVLHEISFVTTPANGRAGVVEKNMSIKKSLLKESETREILMKQKILTESEVNKNLKVEDVKVEKSEDVSVDASATEKVEKSESTELAFLKEEVSSIKAAVEKMSESKELLEGMKKSLDETFEKIVGLVSSSTVNESVQVEKSVEDESIEISDEDFARLVSKMAKNKLSNKGFLAAE